MVEKITGYAARFRAEATIGGAFREYLAPGCFGRTLRENPDVVMVLDHDSGRVLGRVSAGTLNLREDAAGLYFELTPDATTPSGMEAIGTVRRGDIAGCSFGFRVLAEEWQDGGDRLPLRIIKDVDLFEITLTAFPAYANTSAAIRSISPAGEAAARAQAAMRRRGISIK